MLALFCFCVIIFRFVLYLLFVLDAVLVLTFI